MAVFDNPDDVTVDALVGEGKKFKTVDELARGKAEADRVIEARNQELANLREELGKREAIETVLERLNRTPQSAPPVVETQQAATTPSFTDEDLDARIKEVTSRQEQARQTQVNVETVTNKLLEVYGDENKANIAIKQRADALGVSVEFLQDVAAKSPKAFFAQLGIDNVAPTPTPNSSSGNVNTEMLGGTRTGGPKPGTYEYFENIRRTQGPRAYFAPEVQTALMKAAFDAAARGEAFGPG